MWHSLGKWPKMRFWRKWVFIYLVEFGAHQSSFFQTNNVWPKTRALLYFCETTENVKSPTFLYKKSTKIAVYKWHIKNKVYHYLFIAYNLFTKGSQWVLRSGCLQKTRRGASPTDCIYREIIFTYLISTCREP